MRTVALLSLALLGCRSEGSLEMVPPELDLVVETPTYGEFLGDSPVTVTGHVSSPIAKVLVEGTEALVRDDGWFTVELPFEKAYRVVDVEASLYGSYERIRIPVFRGLHPAETWPGGATLRLTPAGLAKMGEGLGAQIDELGWADQLLQFAPPLQTGMFDAVPVGVSHEPTIVALDPVEGGIDTAVVLREVTIDYEVTVDIAGFPFTLPAAIGFEEIRIGALAVPQVDELGMLTLELTDATVDMGDPIVDVMVPGFEWIGSLLGGLELIVEPIGELVLDLVLEGFGTIELGGPFVFDTELMGTTINARLSDVFGDPDGLGAGIGIGLGEPAAIGPLGIPTPADDADDVHMALGLHEGLLQLVIDNAGILDMLKQDLQLAGTFGELIGNGVRALPGGDDAPSGDGWCLQLDPGTAEVVRLQDRIDPLAELYLPDVNVQIGVMDGTRCEEWLEASVAFELGLVVKNGTKIEMDLVVAEGAVLEYGAEKGTWTEEEVVAGLGTFLESVVGLFAGQLEFDLADLMGGGLGLPGMEDVKPRIVDAYPLLDETGEHPEGLYTVAVQLWD